jgi:hypothetical protein
MPIQIEVQDIHAQLLVDFYVGRLKVLRDEILEREKETRDINGIIQKLRKREPPLAISNGLHVDKSLYSEKWPWVKKVQFALGNQEKPLTTKEIVDVLTEYEPSFLFDRKRAVASISSILSSKSGDDKDFMRVDSESGEFAYTLSKNGNNKKHDAIDLLDDDEAPF